MRQPSTVGKILLRKAGITHMKSAKIKVYDGLPLNGLPLTVGEARKRLMELIPEELIVKQIEKDSK